MLIDNTWADAAGIRAPSLAVPTFRCMPAPNISCGHSDVMNGIIVCSQATLPESCNGSGPTWACPRAATIASSRCAACARWRVRLERHTQSALAIAEWLQQRAEVAEVIFPALPGSRGHELWKRDFTGACGLFGVVLHPVAKARVDAHARTGLRLFRLGWSWGGFESLIIPAHPERIRTATRWEAAGPYLRLHVGLEDPQDLIADLEDGLTRLASNEPHPVD